MAAKKKASGRGRRGEVGAKSKTVKTVAGRRKLPSKSAGRRPATETLTIKTGRLGAIGPSEIDVHPLTVIIGRQGTGKSLLAQMLYFFRGLPGLVRLDAASARSDDAKDARQTVRRIVDGMRSSRRSFARLTVPSVALRWRGSLATSSVHAVPHEFDVNMQSANSQVVPGKALRDLVELVAKARHQPPRTALFVPTERLLYAMALGPTSFQVMGAPLILQTFAQTMDDAGRIQSDWPDGAPDTKQGRWIRDRLRGVLGGEAHLRGSSWRWEFEDGGKLRGLDLDMASSGQRANWPLALIPQTLFSLRARGELAEGFTLYVEEPEIHLHPDAERAVVEVLAYLVNNGIRVVLTTHSLTVLYTINNLLLASSLGPNVLSAEVPPEVRLRPEDVAAYHLGAEGRVDRLSTENGTIDEAALGSVADDLARQLNRIMMARGAGE